ncbi:RNA polymerase-associated protein RapA [Aureibacter tunicatorum]|uniref:ATP-dependent helicase HepA n=1 Tax=Aureibacter tunicatorum TaxID=866807 RepID=A0AAE3XLS4_9BACT|nr:RNA polymerase-associated protein RapA [Aureibacter tunicatorum]MDR6239252.1 ATP-dependent helicase HepA [Aureibacter tunicatorum]BDD04823.1 RNA polymerase-associated protein RapA [Aureibacter tunicatorum]
MSDFFPNQRWTSDGEPELGIGIVIETYFNRVKINFPSADQTRQYAIDNAPLRRVSFKPGDTVFDKNQRPFVIDRIQEDGDLILYINQNRTLSEADLGDVTMQHGVDEKLLSGEIDHPSLFSLRRSTLAYDHQRKTSPINGFAGGRIDLIPHQLYIAHEVSSRYSPRVLLSDQVGLGKTIEACLILHRLILSERVSRVLIVVPDTLIHQWFVEMLRRFNLWFHIFDEERCEALDETAPDGNPFLDDQLVICSISFLAKSPKRSQQAVLAGWDMLVVDEAHHLEWSTNNPSPEYEIVEILSKIAKGLLLLTATPEQLGEESHFARLRLLDPERYNDYEAFLIESNDQKSIAKIVEKISSDKSLSSEDKSLLEEIFDEKKLSQLEKNDTFIKNQIIEDLLDQHGPGRVIFRNTRSAMSGFPSRKAHRITLTASEQEAWVNNMSKEFLFDLGESEKPQFDYDDDPRTKWLVSHVSALKPAKALLICKSKAKVLALENALEKLGNLKTAVFHEDMSIVQRDRNAAWFSEPEGANILLCSEIGSEGRNFQFAHHLILFDLPVHPELLEQRIGRLDRIGQTQDIQIYIPYLKGSPQETFVRWYHEGLNAFEENIEGGNQISQTFHNRLIELATSRDSIKIDKLINDTIVFHEKLKRKLSDGRDKLLEMNSFRPKIAQELIEQIQLSDQSLDLEIYMTKVFEHFSIEMEDLSARTYFIRPSRSNREAFPSIPDKGISITFDRIRALNREDLSFVTWDHPMVTGAIDMMLSEGIGSASYGKLKGTGKTNILLETTFILETNSKNGIDVNRFLPSTPLRIVVDHHGEEQTQTYTTDLINKHLIPGNIEQLLNNDIFADSIIPNMLDTATQIAEQLSQEIIHESLSGMNQTLDHEIGRLAYLFKKNQSIRTDEIHTALDEKNELTNLIENARIRLDSIMLITEG